MKAQPKLIVAPIREFGSDTFEHHLCYVSTTLDAMQEPNLESVICQRTMTNLLPKMDSVSKQKVLHNLFATKI